MNEHMPARRHRRPVAVFTTYADAERAVDRPSDLGFPVERVAIIGHDLQMVEQVTGRLTYGGAALKGATSGAVLGVVMHALHRGRRDFDAVTMMVPSRFEVVVDEEIAAEATRLLAEAPAVPTQTTTG